MPDARISLGLDADRFRQEIDALVDLHMEAPDN